MTIDDAARLHLYEQAREHWGIEAANTLMNAIPIEPERLASKDDLSVLGAALRSDTAELRGELSSEIAEFRGELRSEIAALRGELRSEIAGLRGELRSEIASTAANTVRTIVFALVLSNATLVGLVFGAVQLS